jgi:hypothetical protein
MPQMGYDTKTDRLTDCQSQCDSDSDSCHSSRRWFSPLPRWLATIFRKPNIFVNHNHSEQSLTIIRTNFSTPESWKLSKQHMDLHSLRKENAASFFTKSSRLLILSRIIGIYKYSSNHNKHKYVCGKNFILLMLKHVTHTIVHVTNECRSSLVT